LLLVVCIPVVGGIRSFEFNASVNTAIDAAHFQGQAALTSEEADAAVIAARAAIVKADNGIAEGFNVQTLTLYPVFNRIFGGGTRSRAQATLIQDQKSRALKG
jgi:hypothetical protein